MTEELKALQAMGLVLPSPAYILGAILFGLIGLVAFQQAKRRQRPAWRWLGLGLMLYPYAVSSTGWLYAVGLALCAGLYYWRA
ncbi:hypothetical protein [Paucibacter sp. KCTC 42545]|uniref:hypothetical protein n=1 Tax=Paucibacter sp. KCTC 42545 TaxID=1768242 RepID=UPI000733A15E|nr:hypothetical protein [Paucibacter sp. KCTC 42545]ALT75973.1 hypothetical protein AT984_00820 [Paucibacter sp. KCTC 42545]